MSILVVCPGCRASFKVSEKFAGQTGACPKCKHKIQVPTKAQEVQVHAPEAFGGGGKTTSGKLATKPIARSETKLDPVKAVAIAGTSLVVLLVAWAGGSLFRHPAGCAIGLILVSPPLVIAAYAFLHDEEQLQPYRGTALYVRSAICTAVYVILWGAFVLVARQGLISTSLDDMWMWLVVAPPFFIVGALTALASLDLDFGNGFFHYACYVVVTGVLAWVAQIPFPGPTSSP
jgi:hypothetical protein